jgi:transglutaminase-like putative cysteine protease
MRTHVTHTTRLTYDTDVVEAVMDVRLGPRADADQRWEEFELHTSPPASVRPYTDGFGNAAHLITLPRPHRWFEVVSHGIVDTLLSDPFWLPSQQAGGLPPGELVDYTSPSRLVPAGPELAVLAEPFRPSTTDDVYDAVRHMMELVNSRFTYVPQSTDVSTTVADVLNDRRGVCQDFAHVLIGLCRAVGIAARYVSGYIVTSSADGSPRRGAGASHAWAEAYIPSHGWRGFDATNNLVASTSHVKMAIGRDYADVPPTRGTFRGQAHETLAVSVTTHVLQ